MGGSMADIDSLIEAIDIIRQEDKQKNLLLGNGFSLSHPVLGKCFRWDTEEALGQWCSLYPGSSLNCPEKVLGEVRLNISKKVLEFYIRNLKKSLKIDEFQGLYQKYRDRNHKKDHCDEFLKEFNNIFTVNYDPLLYFEILKYNEDKEEKEKFKDGFYDTKTKKTGWMKQSDIKYQVLENKGDYKVIYYLHGSYFIIADRRKKTKNAYPKLRKISFSKEEVEDIEDVNDLFRNPSFYSPFLILEDRCDVKEKLIQNSGYLKACQKALKDAKGCLLIYGMSFQNDEHILKTLNENSGLDDIYITYYTNKAKIEKKVKDYIKNKDINIHYVKIKEGEKHYIWEYPEEKEPLF